VIANVSGRPLARLTSDIDHAGAAPSQDGGEAASSEVFSLDEVGHSEAAVPTVPPEHEAAAKAAANCRNARSLCHDGIT
jgi:hypothetical protein